MTNDHDPPGPLGEAGARLRAIRDRVQSIQGCVNRTCCTCVICDRQLFTVLQDLDALLSAPVVSPPHEGAPLDGYCAICYHPLDACRHCDGIAAPVVTQEGE
jgi:hypothetical protein